MDSEEYKQFLNNLINSKKLNEEQIERIKMLSIDDWKNPFAVTKLSRWILFGLSKDKFNKNDKKLN